MEFKIKRFSSNKENEEKDNKKSKKKKNHEKNSSSLEKLAGIGTIVIGAKMLDSVHKNGEVSGRVKLYHGTNKKAKESILKEGLKGSYALDKDSITNRVMSNLGKKDGRKIVYTGRRRTPAYMMALNHKGLLDKDPAIVKMSIPYKEYKNMKRIYDNPEFKGKSKEEWIKDNKPNNWGEKQFFNKYWDSFQGLKELMELEFLNKI